MVFSRRLLLIVIPVLALISITGVFYVLQLTSDDQLPDEKDLHGLIYQEPRRAPDFTLIDQDGEIFTLSSTERSVSLIFFGYAHCPDACPTALIKYRWVQEHLEEDKDRVNFIFITVDPERDDPETLKSYVEYLKIDMKYLTGDEDDLQPVWNNFGIYFEKEDLPEVEGGPGFRSSQTENYLMAHTSLIFIIDKEMNLREAFTLYDLNEDLLADVKFLLEE
jgi:protein SCO1/2|tara:strand:- start:2025 stop:2687 length:663 start_codon:yes stop_codon:yes gene_type:complete